MSFRTIQRKLQKHVYPPEKEEDDGMPGQVPKHGPLVGLYFMAYGVPIMPTAFALSLELPAYTSSGAL